MRPSLVLTMLACLGVGCSQSTSSAGQSVPSTEAPMQSNAPHAASSATTAPPPFAASANAVGAMSACKDLKVDITNDLPDAGVVMNNAAPVGDAGTSDRVSPVEKTINQNRDKFRCCFDAGGTGTPHVEFKMTLVLSLDPGGGVRSASFDRAETDPTSDAVEACIIDIAKSLTYAQSGVEKDTKFRHRFKFKGH